MNVGYNRGERTKGRTEKYMRKREGKREKEQKERTLRERKKTDGFLRLDKRGKRQLGI